MQFVLVSYRMKSLRSQYSLMNASSILMEVLHHDLKVEQIMRSAKAMIITQINNNWKGIFPSNGHRVTLLFSS